MSLSKNTKTQRVSFHGVYINIKLREKLLLLRTFIRLQKNGLIQKRFNCFLKDNFTNQYLPVIFLNFKNINTFF